VLARDAAVEAISVRDGVLRWRVEVSRGVLVGTDGRHVLVLDRTVPYRELCAVDLATGREVWRLALDGISAWPRALGGMLLVHSGDKLSRWVP